MSDPTHAANPALSAGAGAAVLAALGIETAPLFWAVIGGSLGISFAPVASRWRAGSIFVAVVFCASLFGPWLAQRLFGGEQLSRCAFACGLGIFFHPLLNAAVERLPAALDGLMRKLGIGSQP